MSWTAGEHRTVAVLPDDEQSLRIYVLDDASGKWSEVLSNAPDKVYAKPFLEYRTLRHHTGALADSSSIPGHFIVGWVNHHGLARVRMTSPVSRLDPPDGPPLTFLMGTFAYVQNQWATVQPGTAPSLYSLPTLDNVFGIAANDNENDDAGKGPAFYPHADGAPDHDYTVYSDFMVLEDMICTSIAVHRGFPCGPVDVFQ